MHKEEGRMERRRRTWQEVARDWRLILTTIAAGAGVLAMIWAWFKPIPVLAITRILATKADLSAVRQEFKDADTALTTAIQKDMDQRQALQQEQLKTLTAEMRNELNQGLKDMTTTLVRVIERNR
jgi:hypothetical protein